MSSPRTPPPPVETIQETIASQDSLVDYAKSLDCIHCGLCLQYCPTFRITGAEPSSPRGRIHLMRAVGEGRAEADSAYAAEMDFCLLCRHCESVCPAGVRFGEMMEFTRSQLNESGGSHGRLARLARWIGFRALLPNRKRLRLLGSLLRIAQVTRLDRLLAKLGGKRGAGLRDLPAIPSRAARRLLPTRSEPDGERRGEVAFFEGCVMPELFPKVNHATVRSLARLGYAVNAPKDVVCCGSLHAHNGDAEGARDLVRRAIEAFEAIRDEAGAPVPIVLNSAGCGSHLRECHHLFQADDPWRERARAFSERVVDYSELIAAPLAEHTDATLPAGAVPSPVSWDDPCHLCHGQGVRAEPRRILDQLLAGTPGSERADLPDSEACCGSAGIYSLLRPDDSAAVFARKLDALESCQAKTVVTANPGCQLQWDAGVKRAGKDVRVVHLAELVDAALGTER